MTTVNKMIERILQNLEGYTGDGNAYGTLNLAVTSTDTDIEINSPTYTGGSNGFNSSGIIELGSELIYAQELQRNTNTTQYSNVIRGFRGTEAKAWDANTLAKSNPRFPISTVLDAINDTIKSLYPRILAVTQFEFAGVGGVIQYKMPKGCISVLSVRWLPSTATKAWAPITKWKYTNFGGSNAPAEEFGMFGNKTIDIFGPVTGRPVQVVYTTEPTTFTVDQLIATEEIPAAVFTDSNLPSWAEELVILGACWRLASFIDSSRMSQTTVEQAMLNGTGDVRSNNSGSTLAKYFLGMFEQQLNLGMQRQSKELPTTKHKI